MMPVLALPPLWKQACAGILLCLAVPLAHGWYEIGQKTQATRDLVSGIVNDYNGYGARDMPLVVNAADQQQCYDVLIDLRVKRFQIEILGVADSDHRPYYDLCSLGGKMETIISRKTPRN